jgi:hypothetical protein
VLLQLTQMTSVAEAAWIFSNFAPHSRHRYSKMGMEILQFKYTECSWTLQSTLVFWRRVGIYAKAAFLLPLRAMPRGKPLDTWL